MRLPGLTISKTAFLWLAIALCGCSSTLPGGISGDYPVVPITPAVIMAQDDASSLVEASYVAPIPHNYQYTIAAGDVLEFTLWDHVDTISGIDEVADIPKLTHVKVESDGSGSFAGAGTLHIGGLTIADARILVERGLHKYFRHPQFALELAEFHGQSATVSGAVAKPGVQNLTYTPLTLPKALEAAGGPAPGADLAHAEIIHASGAREQVDLESLLYHGNLSQDRVLVANDTLLVPANNHNRIFVMGEVNKPEAEYITGGRLSLTEALTEAGGLNAVSSSSEHIYVVRNAVPDPTQPAPAAPGRQAMTPVVYQLDGSSPEAFALADQFELKPRDVVYVGTAMISQWQRFVSQAIPPSFSYAAQMTH